MNVSVRSDYLDEMVRLAIEAGCQPVHTLSGSGYLLLKKTTARPKYVVAYEIDILFDPELDFYGGLGSLIGNYGVLERVMRSGGARLRYSDEAAADIRIIHLELNSAYFTVLSRMGI